jgi:hypothetical protein
MADTYSGGCFCGSVRIEVQGPAMRQGLCHCTDCRAWSATPLNAYALWATDRVSVVAGEDFLTKFSKTGKTIRMSCKACGGSIMAENPKAGFIDVYPTLLEGFSFKPEAHIYYGERFLDVPDALPKFRDLPEQAGGTGEMITD